MQTAATTRSREIARLQKIIERLQAPRLQMSIIVALTGAVGFCSSYVLLQAGMDALWLRYFIAVEIAYVAFLFFLWCWLRSRQDSLPDALDLIPTPSVSDGVAPETLWTGAGGHSGGAGASGIFEQKPIVVPLPSNTDSVSTASHAAVEGASDVADVLDLEELAIIIVAILALAGAVGAVFWIVWGAPVLFAELLLDAALTAGLYRRLRGVQANHWLQTAIRRTVLQFLAVAVLFGLAGAAMQRYSPGSRSIGQVLQRYNSPR